MARVNPTAKLRLLFLRPFSPADRTWLVERLAPYYQFTEPEAFDDSTLALHAHEADVALGAAISPAVLSAAQRLKLLQIPGAGAEKLDLAALAARNVVVGNSSSHAPQVAEHGLALLLSLMRKVALHDRLLRQGNWRRHAGTPEDEWYQSDPLVGATVGLVGYGAINEFLAKLLSGFDVSLLVHARRPRPGLRMAELEELFTQSQAVVVAVPLTSATSGMIGTRHLLRDDVGPYVVNLGRAEVIDRESLLLALEQRRIRGAALDAPYGGTSDAAEFAELARFDQVVMSPHRAGTRRSKSLHLVDAVENLVAFAQGRPLIKVVDPEAGY